MTFIMYKVTGKETVEFLYGVYAYAKGKSIWQNPYLHGTEEHEEWENGWSEEYMNDDE